MNIDLKAIRAAAGRNTVSWIQPGEGNMAFICTLTPATILELLDRLEAAEKDAERYRWMKSEVKRIPPAWDIHGWDRCIDAAMADDAAIDALMNSMKDEQK